MKISSLENFIVLSESSSINEAAKKLYISQPSLSKSIQKMEDELGYPLLRRKKSGIELTSQGKNVLEGARDIVEIYNRWFSVPNQRPLEQLSIYNCCSFSDFLMPETIMELKLKYPRLRITYNAVGNCEEYVSPDIDEPVVAMTVCDEELKYNLSHVQGNEPIVLMHGNYECLVNNSCRLAEKDSVTLDDLDSMLLMLPSPYSEFKSPSAFLEPIITGIVDAHPNCALEVDSLRNVIDAVRKHSSSFAVSFNPALYRYQGVSEGLLKHIPFRGLPTEGDLCLFYSRAAAKKYSEITELVDILLANAADAIPAAEPEKAKKSYI